MGVDATGRLAVFMAAVTATVSVAPEVMANTVTAVLDWVEKTVAVIQGHSTSIAAAFEPILRRVVTLFSG